MKKIISLLVLFGLSLNIIGTNVFASSQTSEEKLQTLLGQQKFTQIKSGIDSFITKQSTSGKLVSTLESIAKSTLPLEKKQGKLSQRDQVKKALYENILINGYHNLYKNEQTSFSLDTLGTDITEKEKTNVKNIFLGLQKNLVKGNLSNQNTLSFESGSIVTGDIRGNIHLDFAPVGNILGKLELTEILSKIKALENDTSVQLNLQTVVDGVKKNIGGKLHVIKKDEDQYIQIENLVQSGFVDEYGQESFDKISNIFKQGKFIKVSSSQDSTYYNEIFKNIQNTSPKWLQDISNTPLLIPYKKTSNSYILVPSISICNIEKGSIYADMSECNDEEYQKFLKEYFNLGILITLSLQDGVNTIKVSAINENTFSYAEISINTEGELQTLNADVIPNQELFPGEKMSLKFTNGIVLGEFTGEGEKATLRGKLTKTDFGGTFTYSGRDNASLEGSFSLSNKENNQLSTNISLSGKNIFNSSDMLSANISFQSKNENEGGMTISGNYKQSEKEVFSGNVNYNFKVVTENNLSIEAPKNYVDIDDINSGTEDTGATLP